MQEGMQCTLVVVVALWAEKAPKPRLVGGSEALTGGITELATTSPSVLRISVLQYLPGLFY